MKVRMLRAIHIAGHTHQSEVGDVVDLPAEKAERFVELGWAEKPKPAKRKAAPSSE